MKSMSPIATSPLPVLTAEELTPPAKADVAAGWRSAGAMPLPISGDAATAEAAGDVGRQAGLGGGDSGDAGASGNSGAETGSAGPGSPWAPLRVPMYRAFWIASLASNLGTWVHEIGAAWLMTQLDPSPVLVSAVRTSMALPMLLLAVPAGVLADRFDRRRLLLITQSMMLLAAATMAAMTAMGTITPTALLVLTAVIGTGMVMYTPTWQASIPELVPREVLPSAVALGSLSFNLARSVGPAVGGLLIALVGLWSAFAFNALSFAGVIVVVLMWRRTTTESSGGRSFFVSLGDGLRFVARDSIMRHVLGWVMLFAVPASALWSLLPLVVRQGLDLGSIGYGGMVGGIGIGAVIATLVLPPLRMRLGADGLVGLATAIYAAALLLVALATQGGSVAIVVVAMPMVGAGWMMTLTTLNATAQMTVPHPLRARGMACYLMVFATAMGGGALLWGFVARGTSVQAALLMAAACLLISIALGRRLSLGTALSGGR